MADQERSPKGRGPELGQSRRQVLQTGLGLAGTALALHVMAAARPAAPAVAAAQESRNSGKRSTTDAQIPAKEALQHGAQSEPVHPALTQAQPAGSSAGSIDGTLPQQGAIVPEIGDFSPQIGIQWLEQHWQDMLKVGAPVGIGAIIVKIVHDRVSANKEMASSFQQALTLLGNADIESKAIGAQELLYLLSNPRSEQYHQRIFATAVGHFRQRNVEHADQRESLADFKLVPVFVFAASAVRESLEGKGANVGAAREEALNASSIHLDGLSLREADLSYLMLKQATFTGAVLSSADFSHADLAGADLRHTTLNRTNLSHAILSGTKLNGARARNADLSHAILRNTDLEHADLSYANLEEAQLGDDAHVVGANIFRATGLTAHMRQKLLEMGAIEQDSLLA